MIKAVFMASSYEFDFAREYFGNKEVNDYLFGKYFENKINDENILFFKIGVGKTLSSASCQHIIDKFKPNKIFLIGTCGLVNNEYKLFDIVLPNETCEYNLSCEDICFYGTDIDVKEYEFEFVTGCIATSDIPLTNENDSKTLKKEDVDFVDMESACVSKVCELNKIENVIIKGISDLPYLNKEKEYNWAIFQDNIPIVMKKILDILTQKILKNEL